VGKDWVHLREFVRMMNRDVLKRQREASPAGPFPFAHFCACVEYSHPDNVSGVALPINRRRSPQTPTQNV
jgi:hypothetical protein